MTSIKYKGFTLIELLVAVAVGGILMGALIMVLNPVGLFGQGRDGRRLSDLTTIQAALEQYYAENGKYPADVPAGGTQWSQVIGGRTIIYLKSVPKDPNGTAEYKYCPDNATTLANYQVCATVEDVAGKPTDCKIGSYTLNDNCSSINCCLTNPF